MWREQAGVGVGGVCVYTVGVCVGGMCVCMCALVCFSQGGKWGTWGGGVWGESLLLTEAIEREHKEIFICE